MNSDMLSLMPVTLTDQSPVLNQAPIGTWSLLEPLAVYADQTSFPLFFVHLTAFPAALETTLTFAQLPLSFTPEACAIAAPDSAIVADSTTANILFISPTFKVL